MCGADQGDLSQFSASPLVGRPANPPPLFAAGSLSAWNAAICYRPLWSSSLPVGGVVTGLTQNAITLTVSISLVYNAPRVIGARGEAYTVLREGTASRIPFHSVLAAVAFMFMILEPVRRRALCERHSILWLLAGLVLLAFGLWRNLVDIEGENHCALERPRGTELRSGERGKVVAAPEPSLAD